MFVRIVRGNYGYLYDCGRVDLRPDTDHEDAVLVDMIGIPEIGDVSHVVHKDTGEVYIMNDDGQTIDSYRWPSLKDDE